MWQAAPSTREPSATSSREEEIECDRCHVIASTYSSKQYQTRRPEIPLSPRHRTIHISYAKIKQEWAIASRLPWLAVCRMPRVPISRLWSVLPRRWATVRPSWSRLHRHVVPTPVHLLLHVRPLLQVLMEMADSTADFFPRFERERDDGHKAESEPFPRSRSAGDNGQHRLEDC